MGLVPGAGCLRVRQLSLIVPSLFYLPVCSPPCLVLWSNKARLPLASDVPAPYNDMRKGIRALRDGSRLRLAIPATNTPDMCYFDALDAIKPPPEFFNDPVRGMQRGWVGGRGRTIVGGLR